MQFKQLLLTLVFLSIIILISACGHMEPMAYHPISEVPEGPGLLTGKDGAIVLSPGGETAGQDTGKKAAEQKVP